MMAVQDGWSEERSQLEIIACLDDDIAELYRQIEFIEGTRARMLDWVDEQWGRTMRANNQRTKVVEGFRIATGLEHKLACECHGAAPGECDSMVPRFCCAESRPFVRIKRLEKAEAQ